MRSMDYRSRGPRLESWLDLLDRLPRDPAPADLEAAVWRRVEPWFRERHRAWVRRRRLAWVAAAVWCVAWSPTGLGFDRVESGDWPLAAQAAVTVGHAAALAAFEPAGPLPIVALGLALFGWGVARSRRLLQREGEWHVESRRL